MNEDTELADESPRHHFFIVCCAIANRQPPIKRYASRSDAIKALDVPVRHLSFD